MSDACPKCGHPKAAESCPKCGLVFARLDEAALEHGAADELVKLWEHVEADWQDRARHALLLEHAMMFGSLGYAAGRYRSKGDDPVAVEQLERITKRLEQTMLATKGDPPTKSRRGLATMIGILLFFAAALGLLFLLKG